MSSDETKGSSSYLGPGSKFTGRLTTNGLFVINGQFDGDIVSGGTISIGSAGSLKGKVSAPRILVKGGAIGGQAKARVVEISPDGKATGWEVEAGALILESGAVVDGAKFSIGDAPALDDVPDRPAVETEGANAGRAAGGGKAEVPKSAPAGAEAPGPDGRTPAPTRKAPPRAAGKASREVGAAPSE